MEVGFHILVHSWLRGCKQWSWKRWKTEMATHIPGKINDFIILYQNTNRNTHQNTSSQRHTYVKEMGNNTSAKMDKIFWLTYLQSQITQVWKTSLKLTEVWIHDSPCLLLTSNFTATSVRSLCLGLI